MENKVKVLYLPNRSKKNVKGLVPIYLRITYNSLRLHKSTGFHIKAEDWDVRNQRVKGSTLEIHAMNSQLDTMKVKVLQVVNQLILNDKPFNVQTIKKMLDGNDASQITLMRVCDEHIKEMQKLKGKDYEQTTIIKYKNTVLRLKQFLKYKYRRKDIFLYELNFHFISEFEAFLKYKYDNSTTTCYKHYQRFTRMIRRAISKGYLEKYPFGDYKIRMPKKKIQYLTQAELNRIELQDFKAERLNIIRDIFVFCCYNLETGIIGVDVDGISIYPNPTREMLHIEGLHQETLGRIYNLNGQMLLIGEIGAENGEINVSGLPSGMYILKLNVDDRVVVKRFTKE